MSRNKAKTLDTSMNGQPFVIVPEGEGTLSSISTAYVRVRDLLEEIHALELQVKTYKGRLQGEAIYVQSRATDLEVVQIALLGAQMRLTPAVNWLEAELRALSPLLDKFGRPGEEKENQGLWKLVSAQQERLVAHSNYHAAYCLRQETSAWMLVTALKKL